MKRAVYPGSFDPMTLGHLDIIKRASQMFDELIVAVLNNNQKSPLFSVDERVKMIQDVTTHIQDVEVTSFSGLLVDFAKEKNSHIVVRGLRAVSDFEYELQMAQTNRTMMPDIDTVFLSTELDYSYLSSSIVREVASLGGDISKFLPKEVINLVKNKYNT